MMVCERELALWWTNDLWRLFPLSLGGCTQTLNEHKQPAASSHRTRACGSDSSRWQQRHVCKLRVFDSFLRQWCWTEAGIQQHITVSPLFQLPLISGTASGSEGPAEASARLKSARWSRHWCDENPEVQKDSLWRKNPISAAIAALDNRSGGNTVLVLLSAALSLFQPWLWAGPYVYLKLSPIWDWVTVSGTKSWK